jgi:hypothetical protein
MSESTGDSSGSVASMGARSSSRVVDAVASVALLAVALVAALAASVGLLFVVGTLPGSSGPGPGPAFTFLPVSLILLPLLALAAMIGGAWATMRRRRIAQEAWPIAALTLVVVVVLFGAMATIDVAGYAAVTS